MGRPRFSSKQLLARSLFFIGITLSAGCGSSDTEAPFASPLQTEGTVNAQGGAIFTLESTLDASPISAKSIEDGTSVLKFKTFDSSGNQTSTSEPIEVSPKISVRVPADTAQVQIEYLDSSSKLQEVWGSPLPPLDPESEFVVRNTNPDPTIGVTRVEVTGPKLVPFGIPTQFQARAFYQDGSSRVVTNSATFVVDGRSRSIPNGLLNPDLVTSDATTVKVNATFGGKTSDGISTSFARIKPTSEPFFTDSTGEFNLASLILESYGVRAQLRAFSDFEDGVRREVTYALGYLATPTGIVDVNSLAQVTGFDAGTTTVKGENTEFPGAAALEVTVERDLLETIYDDVRTLPTNITGLSPIYGLGDLNGDGRTDLAGLLSIDPSFDPDEGVAFSSEADFTRLAIYLGNGDGSFQSPIFVALPFSNTGPLFGQLEMVSSDRATFAVVSKEGDNRLAIVAGPTLPRAREGLPARVTTQTLPVAPKQLLDARQSLLLVRGEDDSLHSVFIAGSTPTVSQSPLSFSGLGTDDYLGAHDGIMVQYRVTNQSLRFFEAGDSNPTPIRTVFLNSPGARATDFLIYRRQERRSEEQVTALVAVPGLSTADSGESFNSILIDLGNQGRDPAQLSLGDRLNSRLSPMILEAANRRAHSLMVSGATDPFTGGVADPLATTLPELHDQPNRSTTVTGFPSRSFDRFETGDVTGDGTTDIVSWRNGILTVFQLAAEAP